MMERDITDNELPLLINKLQNTEKWARISNDCFMTGLLSGDYISVNDFGFSYNIIIRIGEIKWHYKCRRPLVFIDRIFNPVKVKLWETLTHIMADLNNQETKIATERLVKFLNSGENNARN